MIPSIDLLESDVFAVLRAFLLSCVVNAEVVRGQDNRVPEPLVNDFIVMTPILRERIHNNLHDYVDSLFFGSITDTTLTITETLLGSLFVGVNIYGVDVLPDTIITAVLGGGQYTVSRSQTVSSRTIAGGVKTMLNPVKMTIQCDVHGVRSCDNAHIITTAFRDVYACDKFAESNKHVYPLFSSDPKQMPFNNSEQQVEERWVVDLTVQVNPIVTISQQFFDDLTITAINAQKV
jgi:hypothetical protein